MFDGIERNYEGIISNRAEICKAITGLQYSDLLGLTGVFGKYDYSEVSNFCEVRDFPLTTVGIRFPANKMTILVELNFVEEIITNTFLKLTPKKNHTGARILNSQIQYGRDIGFKAIQGQAIGKFSQINHYSGYIAWAKLGYTMRGDSLEEFEFIMRKGKRKERTLEELMKTKSGEKFWIRKGQTWKAVFDLTEGSKNIEKFDNYKLQRGLLI